MADVALNGTHRNKRPAWAVFAPKPVDSIDFALLGNGYPRAVRLYEPDCLDGDSAPLGRLRENGRRVVLGIVSYRNRANERVDAIVVTQRVGAALQDEERTALAGNRAVLILRKRIKLGTRRKRHLARKTLEVGARDRWRKRARESNVYLA